MALNPGDQGEDRQSADHRHRPERERRELGHTDLHDRPVDSPDQGQQAQQEDIHAGQSRRHLVQCGDPEETERREP
jgi:hypothetical protein